MMRLIDENGRVIKRPDVVEYLHSLVLSDPDVAAVAYELEPDPQRWGGSALHFSARARSTGEPALLKVNVAADQLWWTRMLAATEVDLVPRVFGTGDALRGAGFGWILWERVRGGLYPGSGHEFDMILEAGVRFQIASRRLADAARAVGVVGELRLEGLVEQLERGVRRAAPAPAQHLLCRVESDWAYVNEVCELEICHGDLHMANAVCREEPPGGVALLIDHHPMLMPWACEPAKPEILNAEPTRRGCRRLVARQAAIRSRFGLAVPGGGDLERVQAIVLGWWAIQMWAYTGPSPDPHWRARDVWHAENAAYIAAAVAAGTSG